MRPIDADKFKSHLEKAMEKMHLIHGVKGVDVGAVIKTLEMQPTADVVPREEVDKAKNKGATEVLGILYKELVYYHENIKNEYMELPQKSTNTARFRGALSTVEHICNIVLRLGKKYTEEQQSE